jgi:tripartite-type tricarboxylate transporter receptor subunit TctC
MRRFSMAAVAVLMLLDAGAAVAQQAFPSRTVRLLVGAAPGGNPDVLGRMMGQRLSEMLGQPFVVENAAGAGGVVAAASLAKAAPDGHTLMLGDSGALAIAVALQSNLPYQVLRDFTPITALATVPTLLVAAPSVAATNLADFIALAKKEPNKLSYGSAGPGSIHHLTMAIFADAAGIELLHVPYRGGAPMVGGLLANEVNVGWSGIPNLLPHIASGKLKAYCISIRERSKSVPAVPTCQELGQKGFDVASMIGLQGPAGLSPAIVETMQKSVAQILREPALANRMNELGMVMQENGTAHYQQYMKDDLQKYGDAVRRLKIEVK